MPSLSYCGIDCSKCSWREPQGCKTCKEYRGDIWHGPCRVAKCCIARGLEDCGQCEDFPCGLLKDFAFDKVHGDSGERIANLCGSRAHGEPQCASCCGQLCKRTSGE